MRSSVNAPVEAPAVVGSGGEVRMKSFDPSLKYLLHHAPADFLRFGSGDRASA